MRYVISKQITALYDAPGDLLNYDYFRQIRQKLFNEDPFKQKEESGATKKNVMTETGFGGNTRQNNPGAGMGDDREPSENQIGGIGSGYNDGGAADDEIGPGFTSTQPNPYFASDVDNKVFFDIKMKNSGKDSKPVNNNIFKKIINQQPLRPLKRFNVDKLN